MKEAIQQLPTYSYLYLGDNLNAPYGGKTDQEIFAHTLAGVEWLFAQGAELVVLACNTASAVALRKIQQEVLPLKYPEKKVLGIIIPTSEEAEKFTTTNHIGVLATEATVRSRVFDLEMAKENANVKVTAQSGGRLVELLEADAGEDELQVEIKRVTNELLMRDEKIDVLILGCTHYALIAEKIKNNLTRQIKVINEAPLVVAKLSEYLLSHPEVRGALSNNFKVELFTTTQDAKTRELMNKFYGQKIEIKSLLIG